MTKIDEIMKMADAYATAASLTHKTVEARNILRRELEAALVQGEPRLRDEDFAHAYKNATGCFMVPTGDDLIFARAIEAAVRKQFGVTE